MHQKLVHPRLAAILSVALSACVGGHQSATRASPPEPPSARAWIDSQPAICGEIRGRVILQSTGEPLGGALVSIDGTNARTMGDRLGVFRLRRDPSHPDPAILRIRRVGVEPVLLELRGSSAAPYVIEIVSVMGGFHRDNYVLVTVRRPWTCEPAT